MNSCQGFFERTVKILKPVQKSFEKLDIYKQLNKSTLK